MLLNPPNETTTAPRALRVLACLAGLGAALCAEGSVGLFGYPLLRAMTWVFLAIAIVAGLARISLGAKDIAALGIATAIGVLAIGSSVPAARIAGVAVICGGLAWLAREDEQRRLMTQGATAILIFAIYAFALRAVPSLWHIADSVAGMLGVVAGTIAGHELDVGTTFAGVDMLVLFGSFTLLRFGGLRLASALLALLVAHVSYLFVVASSAHWWKFFSEAESGPLQSWHLPAVCFLLDLLVVAAFVAFAHERPTADVAQPSKRALAATLLVLAGLVPAFLTLPFGRSSLAKKHVVASDNVYGNWERPKHDDYGRLSIGMYGMLETFVKSHGGTFAHEEELTAEVLAKTDVLMLLYPHEEWKPGELERIHDFVRKGGSLVVFGEHTIREKDGKARFNDVLEITDMHVPFDSATFEVGGWLQSYDPHVHPICSGIGSDRNAFGVVIGASVQAAWPARPLLLGRWGFNDFGDEKGNAMMGNHDYNPGERLGDIVLIAEQEVGDGLVIAFGDTSSVTNGITMGVHDFNARLLGYLATRPASPKALWRQVLGSLLISGLVGLVVIVLRSRAVWLAVAAALFGLSVHASDAWAYELGTLLPDGRLSKPNDLAYFDTSHFGKYDDEAWRLNGTMGIRMTLNRNGYQCLELHDFDERRIERAGLVVSLAPQRAFTADERRTVKRFVAGGGTFIVTASYPDRRGSEALLRDFGFELGRIDALPGREPQPMGHFKAPYWPFDDGSFAHVRFHEAWPVSDIAATTPPLELVNREHFDEADVARTAGYVLRSTIAAALPAAPKLEPARILAYGIGNYPVILRRDFGEGHFIVIGDGSFAHEKNLEQEGGQPFEGLRENADFWRWLLTGLRGDPWYPENPAKKKEDGK